MNIYKRDYKAENLKERETKTTRLVKIKIELFERLQEKLKKDGKTFNGFVIEKINEYLKEQE